MHRANRLLAKPLFGGDLSSFQSTVGSVVQQWSKNKATIFLKRIKWVTGRGELESHFSKFGEIKDIAMFFDPSTGLHRGHASITFDSAKSAEEAIEGGPHHIDGAMITAHLDMPKPLDTMAHNKMSWHLQSPKMTSYGQSEPPQYRPSTQQRQNMNASPTRPTAAKGGGQRRWSTMALGKMNSADGME